MRKTENTNSAGNKLGSNPALMGGKKYSDLQESVLE